MNRKEEKEDEDEEDLNEEEDKCESEEGGTVKVANIEVLYKELTSCSSGTLAFLQDEEALLIKVARGWQYVMLGNVIAQ